MPEQPQPSCLEKEVSVNATTTEEREAERDPHLWMVLRQRYPDVHKAKSTSGFSSVTCSLVWDLAEVTEQRPHCWRTEEA